MFGRPLVYNMKTFTLGNQNWSFNFLRRNGLTPNLVIGGGQKHVFKVRLRSRDQDYLASVLVCIWFSRLFIKMRATGRVPDPHSIFIILRCGWLGNGLKCTVCPKDKLSVTTISRQKTHKGNQAYSMSFIKSVKPLPVRGKGGRGSILLHSGRRELNTYNTVFMKVDRSYNTCVKSEYSSLNSTKGLDEIIQLKNWNTSNTNYMNKQVFRILRFDYIWVYIYQKLLASTGTSTLGFNGNTIDGTSPARLWKIKTEVLFWRFQWSDIRWVHIPKRTIKQRFLGVHTLKDRVV